jgi:ferrochelatase
MGGPDSLRAVRPFLYQLFSDRELIRLPAGALLQKPFAALISVLRAPKVRLNYAQIGGKSPQLMWTNRQVEGVASLLGDNVQPYVAMRYWTPRADEAVKKMRADGVEQAVVLSLYPHYTGATTGSSLNDFSRAVKRHHPRLRYSVIREWYAWPAYLDALTSRVREGLEKFHEMVRDEVTILFSAHALPQKFTDRGDPYLEHVQATVKGVIARLGEQQPWSLAFQSRSGPVKWMEPETVNEIDRLAASGSPGILIVPVSFVSDHIETLQEIDYEYRMHAEKVGVPRFERAPSLNDHTDFIQALAELVKNHLTTANG